MDTRSAKCGSFRGLTDGAPSKPDELLAGGDRRYVKAKASKLDNRSARPAAVSARKLSEIRSWLRMQHLRTDSRSTPLKHSFISDAVGCGERLVLSVLLVGADRQVGACLGELGETFACGCPAIVGRL